MGDQVGKDREMGYPILMKLILPSGILGLTFVSLLAAFMNTVDTHINWAASYLVNDVYKRFLHPGASRKHLILMSRLSVVFIALISVLIASQITSIEKAWKFFVAIGAGMGLPQILRWVWWRVNAWTEITGMLVAFLTALFLYFTFPQVRAEYLLFWIIAASVLASIIATFITKPVDEETLKKFIVRVKPFGFWKGMVSKKETGVYLIRRIIMWLLGVTATFSGMFGIGYILMCKWTYGLVCLVLFGVTLLAFGRFMTAEE